MEQVITNRFEISPQQFSLAYKLKEEAQKSAGEELMNLILKTILSSAIPGILASTLGQDFFFIMIALAILLPVLLIGYSIYKKRSNQYSYKYFGYINQPQFAVIDDYGICFIYEDKTKQHVNMQRLTYVRKTKTDFVIFHDDEQMHMIPLSAFQSEEEIKFFQRNYTVHYI